MKWQKTKFTIKKIFLILAPAKPGARCVLDCTGGAKCVDGTCVYVSSPKLFIFFILLKKLYCKHVEHENRCLNPINLVFDNGAQ